MNSRRGKMGRLTLLLCIISTCHGAALVGRVPTERWLIPRRTFTKLVMRTDTVTETAAASCYNMSPDLPVCTRDARSISPTSTVPMLQTATEMDEKRISDLLSGSSDTTWELLGTRHEDLIGPIEIDIHKHHRYDISGESRNAWGFLGLSIDTTVTRIVTVHQTKRILDHNNTVTMLISGCKPTILPFHVPLCEEAIIPTISNNNAVQPTHVFNDTESINFEQEMTTVATEPLLMILQKVSNSQIENVEKNKNIEEKDIKNKEKMKEEEEEKKNVEVENDITTVKVNEKSDENMNGGIESETEVFSLIERNNVITEQPLITEEENKDFTSTTEAAITTLTTQQEENIIESENTTPEPTLEPVTEHIVTIEDTISAVRYLLESSHSNNPMNTVDILPIVNHEMMEIPNIENNNMEMTTESDRVLNMNEESLKQIEGLQAVYVPHEGPVPVEDADTL